jgi:hypothetical protein
LADKQAAQQQQDGKFAASLPKNTLALEQRSQRSKPRPWEGSGGVRAQLNLMADLQQADAARAAAKAIKEQREQQLQQAQAQAVPVSEAAAADPAAAAPAAAAAAAVGAAQAPAAGAGAAAAPAEAAAVAGAAKAKAMSGPNGARAHWWQDWKAGGDRGGIGIIRSGVLDKGINVAQINDVAAMGVNQAAAAAGAAQLVPEVRLNGVNGRKKKQQ